MDGEKNANAHLKSCPAFVEDEDLVGKGLQADVLSVKHAGHGVVLEDTHDDTVVSEVTRLVPERVPVVAEAVRKKRRHLQDGQANGFLIGQTCQTSSNKMR